ncbi:uncharacterized protein LOC128230317 isoform X2 [Mya arenaria]|nr:uncharacterized protein LOC128230317 isoform X2 [Mya arenaria]
MSNYSPGGSQWTKAGEASEEEDEGYGYHGYSRTPDSSTKISMRSLESETRNDSGVGNSSKATNSIGSFSDDNETDYDRGVHDYYPKVKIRSGCGLNLDYDEAHEVKSEHSSLDNINSPRSDISEGIELQTFPSGRRANEDTDDDFNFTRDSTRYQDDFNTDGESDDDTSHRAKYFNMGYRPLEKDVPSYKHYEPSFERSRHSWESEQSTSGLRANEVDVDKKINFSLAESSSYYSRYPNYYPSSSEKVKIEKNSYKRDPPFGRGPEQLHNVGSSISQLISGRPSDEVKNMPEGRKLEPLQPEESRRKKKKKKGSKDDGSAATDENGNPVESLGLNPSQYKSMRESPSSLGGRQSQNLDTFSYGTFQGSVDQSSSRFSGSKDTVDDSAAKKRRKKKNEKQDSIKSEDIEGFKGNLSLDELLNFIGDKNEKNKKKLAATSEDIPSKPQKSSKKNKDKKQKSLAVSADVEETSKGPDTVHAAEQEAQVSTPDNMGNSSGKADIENPVENGDLDNLYQNDKFALLNDKKSEKFAIKKPLSENESDVIGTENHVYEKENDLINFNNRVTLEDTVGFVTVETKKKSEKTGKTIKSEKLESPVSTTEVTIKVDNNVKQKNAKNKKSKPSSPTIKAEFDSVVYKNTSSVLDIADLHTDLDSNFIFTDLYVAPVPKEDEFQVVGKKKKKPGKETPNHQNNIIVPAVNSKQGRRYDDKRIAAPASSSRPVQQAISAHMHQMESDPHMRDLSPSAFPALSGGKSRQQEGRRNSTGDVQIPSVLKTQDDSDLESVKSLPATKGSGAVEGALSPRLSYARMAATVSSSKPLDSQECNPLSCSFESGDSDIDPKKAVWKGSPTERRHSIGSSPEEINKITGKDKTSVSSPAKCSTQDHILADAALKPMKQSTAKITNAWAHDIENKVQEEHSSVENAQSPSGDCKDQSYAKVFSSPEQNSLSFMSNSSLEIVSLSHSSEIQVSKHSIDNSVSETNYVNSGSSSSGKTNSHYGIHKQDSYKVRSLNNYNGKKQKSVIFLDKRVEESTGNLGISFGFEIGSLDKSNPLHKTDDMNSDEIISNKSEQSSESSSVINESVNDLSEPKEATNVDMDSVSCSSSISSVISDGAEKDQVKPSLSNDVLSDTVNKSHLVHINGIVNNVKDVSVHQGKIESSEQSEPCSNQPDHKPQSVPVPTMHTPDAIGNDVYYGEWVSAIKKGVTGPSPTNGPTQYCGLARFFPRNELRSNFNISDAAFFLTREWDRTVEEQKKEPEMVQIHED